MGRLDYDTTGVLILTNDGEFANELTHPTFHIAKTYEVVVKGIVKAEDIKKLEKGVLLEDGKMSQPAKVKVLEKKQNKNSIKLELTIWEGRNHQIKKMMEAINFEVIKLHRKSLGVVSCDKLPIGSYRRLKPFEIKQLRVLAREGKSE